MSTPEPHILPAKHSLLRSTSLVSFMTMLSRVLGFARDMVIAHFFGAGAGVDAFLIAFKIPNFMRRLFAEGAFSQAFVPVLAEYQEQQEFTEVQQFVSRIAGTLGVILFVVTIIAVIATPILVMIFAPGFGHGSPRYLMATYMLRITFPYLMLISLTAMSGAVLNTYGRFGIPAFTPVLLNISLIGAAIYLAPYFQQPVEALAWGVLVAGIVQLGFQIPFLAQIKLLPLPRFAWHDSGVRRVLKLMVPALFGVSVAQVNLLMDTLFASFLPVGSVSWLYFSDRLTNFPLGVFGVAIATVILPHLSRKHSDHQPELFSKALDWAIRCILLIAIPAAIGLFILAGPLLASLLGYGRFGTHDVMMARLSLMAFSVGVPAFMLIKVLASGFYAKQNIKTPVKIGVAAMICNMVLNLILIKPFAHMGLAAATTTSAFVNAGALLYLLMKYDIYQPNKGWLKFAGQIATANILLAAWLIWQNVAMPQWLAWHWAERASHLAYLIIPAMLIYLAALFLSGMRFNDFRGQVS